MRAGRSATESGSAAAGRHAAQQRGLPHRPAVPERVAEAALAVRPPRTPVADAACGAGRAGTRACRPGRAQHLRSDHPGAGGVSRQGSLEPSPPVNGRHAGRSSSSTGVRPRTCQNIAALVPGCLVIKQMLGADIYLIPCMLPLPLPSSTRRVFRLHTLRSKTTTAEAVNRGSGPIWVAASARTRCRSRPRRLPGHQCGDRRI